MGGSLTAFGSRIQGGGSNVGILFDGGDGPAHVITGDIMMVGCGVAVQVQNGELHARNGYFAVSSGNATGWKVLKGAQVYAATPSNLAIGGGGTAVLIDGVGHPYTDVDANGETIAGVKGSSMTKVEG